MKSGLRLAVLPLAALLALSCASKPPTPEPTPPAVTEPTVTPTPTPVPPPAQPAEDLDKPKAVALKAEVLAQRKHIFDLGVPEVLPDDWAKADEAYVSGVKALDAGNSKGALELLGGAGKLFTELLPKGVTALADRARSQADEWKAQDLKAGAQTDSPERFAAGEAAYASAEAAYASADREPSIGEWKRARALYELTLKHQRALGLESLVAEKGFAPADKGNADTALARLADEKNLFDSGGGKTLDAVSKGIDLLDEVVLRLNLVTRKGQENLAIAARTRSGDAEQKSKDLKAEVAVKDGWTKAKEVDASAASLFSSEHFEEAQAGYTQAAELFEAVAAEAQAKRDSAIAAMKAADEAQAQSLAKAQAADQGPAPAGTN